MSLNVQCFGQDFLLLPEGAIYWPKQSMLLVADLHLGKDANFRASGIPVPAGSDTDTLSRLDGLLTTFKPQKIVILGDLFHGRFSKVEMFNQWVVEHTNVEIELVVGNHDRWIRLTDLTVNCCASVERDGILLSHAPVQSDLPVICGHIHPGFQVGEFWPNRKITLLLVA